MAFAANTSVAPERSQAEIRKLIAKYRATDFAIGETGNKAVVMFQMNDRRVKFSFDIPIQGKWREPKKNYIGSEKSVEQEIRRLWRCLLLSIKSKLECVESKISTFEEEFLSHIVVPGGRTMGEIAIPQLKESYENNTMPPLLGYGQD